MTGRLDAFRLNIEGYQMTFWDGDRLEPHLENLGIPFIALEALYQAGVLSFEPKRGMDLSPRDLAELHFLAPFIQQQLGAQTIARLLRSLDAPYNYDHQLIYFDWRSGMWQPYPTIDLCEAVRSLISHAREAQDVKGLKAMGYRLNESLEDIKYWLSEIQSPAE
ncbi:hypothetical protein [Aeromonas veronii]|uniref:hypothetical protein n=1 Tax=Aeromonas veronii TaxID=654 RepID=UPI003D21F46E